MTGYSILLRVRMPRLWHLIMTHLLGRIIISSALMAIRRIHTTYVTLNLVQSAKGFGPSFVSGWNAIERKAVSNVRIFSGGDSNDAVLPSPRVQIGSETYKCEVASRLRSSKNNHETVTLRSSEMVSLLLAKQTARVRFSSTGP